MSATNKEKISSGIYDVNNTLIKEDDVLQKGGDFYCFYVDKYTKEKKVLISLEMSGNKRKYKIKNILEVEEELKSSKVIGDLSDESIIF